MRFSRLCNFLNGASPSGFSSLPRFSVTFFFNLVSSSVSEVFFFLAIAAHSSVRTDKHIGRTENNWPARTLVRTGTLSVVETPPACQSWEGGSRERQETRD